MSPQGGAGRGLQGLVGVRVRGGGAPVTLAVQPGAAAAAALPPVAAPQVTIAYRTTAVL